VILGGVTEGVELRSAEAGALARPGLSTGCTAAEPVTGCCLEMFSELNVQPDDLDALSPAVTERTGVDIVFTQTMQRTIPVYWAVMQKK
jgi:hypothetical protein